MVPYPAPVSRSSGVACLRTSAPRAMSWSRNRAWPARHRPPRTRSRPGMTAARRSGRIDAAISAAIRAVLGSQSNRGGPGPARGGDRGAAGRVGQLLDRPLRHVLDPLAVPDQPAGLPVAHRVAQPVARRRRRWARRAPRLRARTAPSPRPARCSGAAASRRRSPACPPRAGSRAAGPPRPGRGRADLAARDRRRRARGPPRRCVSRAAAPAAPRRAGSARPACARPAAPPRPGRPAPAAAAAGPGAGAPFGIR